MAQPVIDLSNSSNWELIWEKLTKAQTSPTDSGRYFPIPTIEMPIQLESPIFAVLAESEKARSTWKFAGNVSQLIQTGIIGFGTNDVQFEASKKLWLNRVTIYNFPKISTSFSLKFDIPYWYEEISLTVWEYLGSYGDSVEELIEQIRDNELARIEQKVDDIATYGGN
ncbi:MAG: hypothetical protein HC785_08370 [Calothrix sp. CSU_2_0]|nr:hypothetical protein [Calothrix sp. CSU_2_0]